MFGYFYKSDTHQYYFRNLEGFASKLKLIADKVMNDNEKYLGEVVSKLDYYHYRIPRVFLKDNNPKHIIFIGHESRFNVLTISNTNIILFTKAANYSINGNNVILFSHVLNHRKYIFNTIEDNKLSEFVDINIVVNAPMDEVLYHINGGWYDRKTLLTQKSIEYKKIVLKEIRNKYYKNNE